jgi:phosphate-selective porin OprO and OprP
MAFADARGEAKSTSADASREAQSFPFELSHVANWSTGGACNELQDDDVAANVAHQLIVKFGSNRRTLGILPWILIFLACGAAFAQAPLATADAESIQRRLDAQEAEIQRLRKLVESRPGAVEPWLGPAAATVDAVPASSGPLHAPQLVIPTGGGVAQNGDVSRLGSATPPAPTGNGEAAKKEDGWLDLSGEKWTVKLGGHVQMDWIHWAQAEPQIPAQDYFEFRRLRLLADGTGYGVYDFRLQIDIEPENGDGVSTPVVDIKDAYLTMHELPWARQFRVGNFFVPFSLEQVTNDTNNIFLERSIPTQGIFAADREVGMALYGMNETQDFTWTVGAFMDSISESLKERIDDNQGSRVSGRLTWLPYYDEPSNGRYLFHTGVGVLYTDDYDGLVRFSARPSARPQIHEGPRLIDTGNLPASSYTTGNIELATVWGPVSLQSEMFISSVDLDAGDPATLYGMYVYGSYFLTGENRIYERFGQHGAQFARNVPLSNFFFVPGCHGPGAWEAKVRWSNLTLTQVDAGHYNDLTVGFNWYWTERIRVMFDWIHPITTVQTPFGATDSDIIATRFDFNF